ncbi:MAG: T9SS type A sorting domain-containing protein [candidate division KSB1 bacterium]|nr:T9SS type A sorting domain-containing protein [candidate division KSB1 bacterium]MDZ7300944.1 T9SS type A sorting domain-containing protein [candidate division KSB1 bacterium]MDZ7310378.1 T9SS type A sorting domain-containing protein [candidate division KSB1 bacterium]
MRKGIIFISLLLSLTTRTFAQPSSLPVAAKGMWIWKLWSANGGNLNAVIDKLKATGVKWVVAKMGDSDSYYNKPGKSLYNWAAGYGGMDSVVSIFHRHGIKLLGYQYVYGTPQWGVGVSEAEVANQILNVKGLDGLLIDAEIEYDVLANRVAAARTYLDTIRAHHPKSFLGLTSWARISVHATFPWTTFLSRVEVNMPQTYWAARPLTPQAELSRMSSEFTYYTQIWVSHGDSAAAKPIMPLGQAEYFGYGNDIQQGDIRSFCNLSQQTYRYAGVSLWEYSQIALPFVWEEYAASWLVTSVAQRDPVSTNFRYMQNYPNPFNPSTTIEFDIPAKSNVKLVIYDIFGREVRTLANSELNAGRYTIDFDGGDLPSGVYFCLLKAGQFVQKRKMARVK